MHFSILNCYLYLWARERQTNDVCQIYAYLDGTYGLWWCTNIVVAPSCVQTTWSTFKETSANTEYCRLHYHLAIKEISRKKYTKLNQNEKKGNETSANTEHIHMLIFECVHSFASFHSYSNILFTIAIFFYSIQFSFLIKYIFFFPPSHHMHFQLQSIQNHWLLTKSTTKVVQQTVQYIVAA